MSDIQQSIAGLHASTRYVIRVRAVDGLGVKSEWSNALDISSAADSSTPEPPRNLTFDFTSPSLIINWEGSLSNTDGTAFLDFRNYEVTLAVGGVTKIYSTTSPTFIYTFEQNALDFTTAQPQIVVSVKAVDVTGNKSLPISGTAINAIPDDPTDPPVLAVGFTMITITAPGQIGIVDLAGFNFYHSTNGTVYTPLYSTENGVDSYAHNVGQGTTHYYKYKVRDLFNQLSDFSPVESATTFTAIGEDEIAPDSPTGLAVTGHGLNPDQTAYVELEWNFNDEDDLASYELRWRRSTDVIYTSVVKGTQSAEQRITNLDPDTLYYFQVRAADVSGNLSDWAPGPPGFPNGLGFTTDKDNIPPAVPSLPTTASGIEAIFLTWNANTDTDFERYELYGAATNNFTPGPGNLLYIGNGTTFTHNVGPNVTRYYRIRAVDTTGNTSAYNPNPPTLAVAGSSYDTYIRDTTPPAIPTGLTSTTGNDVTSQTDLAFINATWNGNNTEADFAGYQLQIKKSADALWTTVNIPKGTLSHRFNGLAANTNYDMQILAYDRNGNNQGYSSIHTRLTARDSGAPGPVLNPRFTVTLRTITWIWDPPSPFPADFDHYQAQVATDAGFTSVIHTEIGSFTSFAWVAPVSGTTYYMRVRAIDVSGNPTTDTGWTTEVHTQGTDITGIDLDTIAPATPTGLSLITGQEFNGQTENIQITATWTANTSDSDLAAYNVRLHRLGSDIYQHQDVPLGTTAFKLTGATGNYASTPDSVATSITGDIDIRAKVSFANFTAASHTIVAKRNAFTSYQFYVGTGGNIQFIHSTSGADQLDHSPGVIPGLTNNVPIWLRVTRVAATGVKSFYWSNDGVTWTSIGNVTGATGAIYDSTDALEIGSRSAGTGTPFNGVIHYVELRNVIDGAVAVRFDPTVVTPSAIRTPASFSNGSVTWTMNGSVWSWQATPLAKFTGLQANVVYGVQVLAYDTFGNYSPYCTEVAITSSKDSLAPGIPLNPRFNVALKTIQWIWDPPLIPVPDFDHYEAQVATDVGFTAVLHTEVGPALSFAYVAPNTNTRYYMRVRAVDVSGNASSYTSEVHADTTAVTGIDLDTVAPATPSGLAVTTGQEWLGQVENVFAVVSWTANTTDADLAAYNVRLRKVGFDQYQHADVPQGIVASLDVPGTPGNYASTPDSVASSVTGDIDLRAKIAADDWTPAAPQFVIAKEQATGGLRSYALGLHTTGGIKIRFAIDGNTAIEANSSTGTGFADGSIGWIRATRVASTGACNFYKSTDGVTWTLVGTANVASTAGTISDNASATEIGSRAGGGSDLFAGVIYYVEVRNGIDGTVVNTFDPSVISVQGTRSPTTVVNGSTTWTLNGAAWDWVIKPASKFTALQPNTLYGAQVLAYDTFGNYSGWSTELTFTTSKDASVPNQVTGLQLSSAFRAAMLQWTANTDSDLANYEIHVGTTPGFTANSTNLYSKPARGTAASIDKFFDATAATPSWRDLIIGNTYYVKMFAVDVSGNRSPVSAEVFTTPGRIESQDTVGSLQIPFEQSFETFDQNYWNLRGGSYNNASLQSGGQHGGNVLRATGLLWLAWKYNIPYDPLKTYKISGRVRVTSAGDTANKKVYIGFEGVQADGVTLINTLGVTNSGNQHYVAVAGNDIPVDSQWYTYVGYVRGTSGSPQTGAANNPNAPGTMHTLTRYIRPLFLLNYNTSLTNNVMEIDNISIEEVGMEIGTVNIRDAAITNLKVNDVQADKITTGSLLATISVTSGQIQTAASGARMVLSTSGLVGYDDDGTTKLLEYTNTGGVGTLNISGAITSGGTITGADLIGGTITQGTTPNWFKADGNAALTSTTGIWLGGSSFGNAAFSVNLLGQMKSTKATIVGPVGDVFLTVGSTNTIFKVDSSGVYLGNAVYANAPFKVDYDGNALMQKLEVAGAGTSTVSGTLNVGIYANGTTNAGKLRVGSNVDTAPRISIYRDWLRAFSSSTSSDTTGITFNLRRSDGRIYIDGSGVGNTESNIDTLLNSNGLYVNAGTISGSNFIVTSGGGFYTDLNAGNGSTAGIIINSANGFRAWPNTSSTPNAVIGTDGVFTFRKGTIVSPNLTDVSFTVGSSTTIWIVDGNGMYMGAGPTPSLAAYNAAPFSVSYAGAVKASNINLAGGTITNVLNVGTSGTQVFTDGATTNTSTTLTSATAGFTIGDVGQTVTGAGIQAGTVISSVTNITTAVMSLPANATATGVTITIGRIGKLRLGATSDSGPRIAIARDYIKAFASGTGDNAATTFHVNATTGAVTLTGTLQAGSVVSDTTITGGTITQGTSPNWFNADGSAANTTGTGIWLGGSTFGNSPFSVNLTGQVIAKKIIISPTGVMNATDILLDTGSTIITAGGTVATKNIQASVGRVGDVNITASASTTLTAQATSGAATLNVVDATAFAATGTNVSLGTQTGLVSYTGKTATTLTGVTGVTATHPIGTLVLQAGKLTAGTIDGSTINISSGGNINFQPGGGNIQWAAGASPGGIIVGNNGFIRNSQYVADPLTGFNLDATGLTVNTGIIKAAALQIGVSTENLLFNSSFENYKYDLTNPTGMADSWQPFTVGHTWSWETSGAPGSGSYPGSGYFPAGSPFAKYYASSQKVVAGSTTNVGPYQDLILASDTLPQAIPSGSWITMSIWVLCNATRNGFVSLLDNTAGNGAPTYTSVPVSCTANVWTRVVHNAFVTGANPLNNIRFRAYVAATSGDIIYFDGAQVELSAFVSTYHPKSLEIPDNYIVSAYISGLTADKINTGSISSAILNLKPGGYIQSEAYTNSGGASGFVLSADGATFQNGSITLTGSGGTLVLDDSSMRAIYPGVGTQMQVDASGVYFGGNSTSNASLSVVNGTTTITGTLLTTSATHTFQISTANQSLGSKVLRLYQTGGDDAFYLTNDGYGYFARGINGANSNPNGGNKVKNSSFESKLDIDETNADNLDYWQNYITPASGDTAPAITQQAGGPHGRYSCRVRINTGGVGTGTQPRGIKQDNPWVAGPVNNLWPASSVWMLSFWVRQTEGTAILPFAGLTVGGFTVTGIDVPPAALNKWQRYVYRVAVPGSDTAAGFWIGWNVPTSAAQHTFSLDMVQLEQGELATTYAPMPEEVVVDGSNYMLGSDLRSSNFDSTHGWKIETNGNATFNNVTVRGNLSTSKIIGDLEMQTGGVIRTAPVGQERMEFSSSGASSITFFSGNAAEDEPPDIFANYSSNRAFLDITSGGNNSNSRCEVQYNSGPNAGGRANFSILFRNNTLSADTSGDFHCFLGTSGEGRFYGASNAERFLVDNAGVTVTGTLEVSGVIYGNDDLDISSGDLYCDDIIATGDIGCATVDTGHIDATGITIPYGGGGIQVADRISSGVNNPSGGGHPGLDNESITVGGTWGGVSFRQRGRSMNVTTNRCVIYGGDAGGNGGEGLFFWQNGDMFHLGQSQNVHIPMGIPPLGAGHFDVCIVGASQQLGVFSSTADIKKEIKALNANDGLGLAGAESPVWGMKPRRYKLNEKRMKEKGHGEEHAKAMNNQHPHGIAGLVVEELYEVAPDAVVCDQDGKPLAIEKYVMMGYMIDAIQHLKERIDRLEGEKK